MRPDSPLVDDVAPSPNFGDRRGKTIDALILHYTGMPSGDGALARLVAATSGVSCHYLVWEGGRITQLVAEADRAWHAGASFWADERDMNSVSLGVEIVNAGRIGGRPPYPAAQIQAVVALCRDLCARHAIMPHRVLAHSDIAPGRKDDPGEWFPWAALAAEGVGVVGDPARVRAGEPGGATHLQQALRVQQALHVQQALRAFGYECPATGAFDPETESVVTAFQRHFRPARIDGIADAETVALLQSLLALRLR